MNNSINVNMDNKIRICLNRAYNSLAHNIDDVKCNNILTIDDVLMDCDLIITNQNELDIMQEVYNNTIKSYVHQVHERTRRYLSTEKDISFQSYNIRTLDAMILYDCIITEYITSEINLDVALTNNEIIQLAEKLIYKICTIL